MTLLAAIWAVSVAVVAVCALLAPVVPEDHPWVTGDDSP